MQIQLHIDIPTGNPERAAVCGVRAPGGIRTRHGRVERTVLGRALLETGVHPTPNRTAGRGVGFFPKPTITMRLGWRSSTTMHDPALSRKFQQECLGKITDLALEEYLGCRTWPIGN